MNRERSERRKIEKKQRFGAYKKHRSAAVRGARAGCAPRWIRQCISMLNQESYNSVLSCDMTHVARRMQTTGGKGLRPVERYVMQIYTDINLEYHSQLSTTFNITVNKPIYLTEGLVQNYCNYIILYKELQQFCTKLQLHMLG